MIYKDSKIEIGKVQMKFKNNTGLLFLIIFLITFFTSWTAHNNNLITPISSILGLMFLVMLIQIFSPVYLKNSINISDISHIKIQDWNKNIDKDRNFWGIAKYKYHFPTGINKKKSQKVIFVHRKKKILAIGFVPDNCDLSLAAFTELGIKIESNTN